MSDEGGEMRNGRPNYFESRIKAAILLCATLTLLFGPCLFAQNGAHPHPSGSASASVVIDSNTPILIGSDEAPVRKAAEDLASDIEKITGKQPEILQRLKESGQTAIFVGESSKLSDAIRPNGLKAPESFSISVHRGNAENPGNAIVLSGADMRGTIYAVYQFSQEYLGIDPLYYWTDQLPAHRVSIRIPTDLNRTFPAPVFTYRGFFINDEDLLTGWAPGEAKDKTYETILRLKGNMVAPGTWIFPDEPQVKLAAKRGLIVTQHHAIPLGLNVARWPKDVPYNYTEHPEILERAWKNAANSYLPDQEVLWSVGLRGLSDVSYASMDPSVRDSNKALGALISKAIADQISIVRAVRPDAKFVTNLWQEGARLVQQGDLKIPPEVATVWADDGYGYIQDHGEVTAGQGIYDHIAMMNGRANQLTEMVPIERSFEEIGRYIKAGATHYYLVNTSDIRPVTMSTRAVMDAVWKGIPEAGADGFYQQWSADEFGKAGAPKLAALYQDYFKAPAHLGDPVHEYGDQLYQTEARMMMLTYMTDSSLFAIPSQSPKWQVPRVLDSGVGPNHTQPKEWLAETTKREIQQCAEAQARWDALWKQAQAIEPLIPLTRRPFYGEQVLTMIAINRESNRMLFLLSKALQDAQNGDKSRAHAEVNQAIAALDEIQRSESQAEYGKWKNWYRGDWLAGIYRTKQMLEVFSKFLDDPNTHLAPPILWDGWEAYYHIMHYEGDRSADVK
jgi:hypothetical protein